MNEWTSLWWVRCRVFNAMLLRNIMIGFEWMVLRFCDDQCARVRDILSSCCTIPQYHLRSRQGLRAIFVLEKDCSTLHGTEYFHDERAVRSSLGYEL